MKPRVLILDDDQSIRSMYARYLLDQGYNIRSAGTLAQARKMLSSQPFEALLLDMVLPDGNVLDSIAEFRQTYPDAAIIVATAEGGIPEAVEAMRRGADNFMSKPVTLADLDLYLRKCIEIGSLRRHQTAQRRQDDRPAPFFGKSPAWKKMMDLASVAAENDAVILLLGETGTGKGILARWIHDRGDRASEPFIQVNCSSLRGEMLASELFGHVKGAFTSAHADKQGLIEVASSGTLFLDEIGDMDIAVQAQFLKVIEEKLYRRVGDVKERTTDFRLICATNHDLDQLSREGTFRSDLYFRINIFPIRVPPLRDSQDDIPELADHLLKSLRAPDVKLPDDVLSLLAEYPWPGNIRELRNVLERALLLAAGSPISTAHFPGVTSAACRSTVSEPTLNLRAIEEDRIRSALDRFDGDATMAAKALGISRATLYRRLREMKAPSVSPPPELEPE